MKDNTEIRLEAALQRILDGKPEHIDAHRKLSVRAVEEEARLGNGSGYYYPDVVEKIKEAKVKFHVKRTGQQPTPSMDKARQSLKSEVRIKEKYRNKVKELELERAQMAATHHQLSLALRKAHKNIAELEHKLQEARQQTVEARRGKIAAIQPQS